MDIINEAIWWVGLVTCGASTIGAVSVLSLYAIDHLIKTLGFYKDIIKWSLDKEYHKRIPA